MTYKSKNRAKIGKKEYVLRGDFLLTIEKCEAFDEVNWELFSCSVDASRHCEEERRSNLGLGLDMFSCSVESRQGTNDLTGKCGFLGRENKICLRSLAFPKKTVSLKRFLKAPYY